MLNEQLKLVKCEKCEFITFFKSSLVSHTCEPSTSTKIKCLGCSNTFITIDSYKAHLIHDHKVKDNEIEHFVKKQNKTFAKPKSKIFIKDVQTLRKPDLPVVNVAIPNIFDSLDLTTDEDILDDFLACDEQIFDDEFDFDDSANLNNDDVPEVEIIEQTDPKGDTTGKISVRKNLCTEEIECTENPPSKIFVRSHESLMNQVIVTEEVQQPSEATTPDCIIVSSEIISPEQTGKIFIRDIETLTSPASENYLNNLQPNHLVEPAYQPSIYVRSLDSLARSSLENQRCQISIKNMETLIEPNLMQPPLLDSSPMIFGQAQNLVIHIRPPQNDDSLLRYRDTSVTPDTLPCSSNVSTCGGNDDVIMLDDHEIPEKVVDNFIETPEIMNLIVTPTIEQVIENVSVTHEVLENPQRNETPNDKDILQKLELQATSTQPMVSIPMDFCSTEEVKETVKKIKVKKTKKVKRKKVLCDDVKSDNNSIQIVFKCSHDNCEQHFSSENLLNYHRKCHLNENSIICPECRCEDFKSFLNLHTHLWRSHKIDIDLYSCNICEFKTPILSRLKNFHAKIHLDVKNYKCSFLNCGKSFKNSKQLANHCQTHKKKKVEKITIESSNKKLRCLECNKGFSSESGLYIHSMEHKNEEKKFNCKDCDYSTNDHNSFRRHKSQHSLVHHYKCPSCDYSSIQSNTYRKHLERNHPELAENLLFKCNFCKFTTISKAKYDGHMVKHSDEDEIENKKKAKIKLKSNEILLNEQTVHVIMKNLLPNQSNDL